MLIFKTMMQNLISLKYWFIKILGGFLVWFEPARELSIMLVVFILIDAALDIWVKIDAKEKINLKKFLIKQMRDITLFLLYILVIHYFQTAYLGEMFSIFKAMVFIPVLAVMFGIIENIEKLTGIPIGNKAKEILSGIFGKMTDKITKKEDEKEN